MPRFEICSDVTGTVWKMEASIGAAVGEDDTVMIIESMKMEIPLASPVAGTVVELLLAEGDAVFEGQHVATVES